MSASARSSPARSLLNVAVYYAAVVAAGWLLLRSFPSLARLFSAQRLEALAGGIPEQLAQSGATPFSGEPLVAVLSMLGALVLVIPVAWIYMITKRGVWYDASVVQTVILLPIAVAGIAMIVQYSIALAFSLAGIAAAVRFRNTLKDTKDAVYIFLAIGVGLAAGMQALGVALMMSVVFNVVVLALWHFDVADIYEGAATGSGRTVSLPGGTPSESGEKPFHGILRIHAADPAGARRVVEPLLNEFTKRWRPGEATGTNGLAYLIRLKKSVTAQTLIDRITTHAAGRDVSVTFEPFDRTG